MIPLVETIGEVNRGRFFYFRPLHQLNSSLAPKGACSYYLKSGGLALTPLWSRQPKQVYGQAPFGVLGGMMQVYQYDPKKHGSKPTVHIAKFCLDCGCVFLCPGNWRKTRRCPACAKTFNEHAKQVRIETAKNVKAADFKMVCERCGRTGSVDIHHRLPIFKGGDASLENLEALCLSCHFSAHKGLLAGFPVSESTFCTFV